MCIEHAGPTMCIIKIRPDRGEDPPAVMPVRPIPTSLGGAQVSTPPSASRSSRLEQQQQQQQRNELRNSNGLIRLEPTQTQAIVITTSPSPRSSRPKIPLQKGTSYSYGSGPIAIEPSNRIRAPRSVSHQASLPARRSGSVGVRISPRQSNVSYRSTREKIIVVDETGRRQESGFY